MAKTIERTIRTYSYTFGKVSVEGGNLSTTVTRTVDSFEKLSSRRQKAMCEDGERLLLETPVDRLYRCDLDDFLKIAKEVTP